MIRPFEQRRRCASTSRWPCRNAAAYLCWCPRHKQRRPRAWHALAALFVRAPKSALSCLKFAN